MTKICKLKLKAGFFDVYTEEGLLCTISDETAFKLNLKTGLEVDDETVDEMCRLSDFETAKRDGARLLSRASNTRYLFCEKLRQKGHGKEAVNAAADFFEKNGFLDDLAFAKAYVRDCVNLKNDGKIKIMFNLKKKGVVSYIAEQVLAEYEFADSAVAQAKKEAAKLNLGDKKDVAKLKRRLYAKGFSLGEINRAVKELGGEEFEI